MSVQMFDVLEVGYIDDMEKALVIVPSRRKKPRQAIDLSRFNPCRRITANVLHIAIRVVIGAGAVMFMIVEYGR